MIKKLSEFILELENFQKEYGDLVVACADGELGDYTPYVRLEENDYWDEIPKGDKYCNIDWMAN
ncbi:MAG TPA: hypothetical protein DCS12_11570 [Clostridiales bacterium]|jgi:hypothetical protein|nr:hypothetical protein [Clostridiales bacterium]